MPRRPLAPRSLATIALLVALGAAAPARAGLLAIGQTDFRMYDVGTTTAVATNSRNVGSKINTITFSPTGKLYGVSQGFPTDGPPGGKLFTIVESSGAPTYVATLDNFIVTEGDIACDPTSGVLYAVDGGGLLFTINTTTGVTTIVGTIPGNVDLSCMAFDGFGNLYIVDQFGPTLLKVNKFNASVIGSVPMSTTDTQVGGLAFDPQNGTCYYAGGYPNPRLFTLNTTNGALTLVGPVAISGGIGGLAFSPPEVAAGVVKEITNTTFSTADGVDITLIGVYSSVVSHFDGLPAHTFSSFNIVPAGSNTILRWTGGTTIPVNDKVTLGFFVVGTQYQMAAIQWKSGGTVTGVADQINIRPHLTLGGTPTVVFGNTVNSAQNLTQNAGNLQIEYLTHRVPLDSLRAGIDRQPIRTDAFPIPPLPIAAGDSLTIAVGTKPAGATHAVVILDVSRSNPGAPDATTDLMEVPLRTAEGLPASSPWSLAAIAAALAAWGLYRTTAIRRTRVTPEASSRHR